MVCWSFDSRFANGAFIGLLVGATLFMLAQYTIDIENTSQSTIQTILTFVPSNNCGCQASSTSPNVNNQFTLQSIPGNGTTSVSPAKLTTKALGEIQVDVLNYVSAKKSEAEAHHAGENELAKVMFQKIRILCWVMTMPSKHDTLAKAVKGTWGKRCNVFFYVSSSPVNNESETVIYNGTDSRAILWAKTKLGFRHAYDKYFDQADWFLKADDDTYMIMENMRLLLLDKDPSQPLYYGSRLKEPQENGAEFMSGGAGYILSKESLRLLIEEGLHNSTICEQSEGGAEDVNTADCLLNLGITLGDSRDQEGKSRFFPMAPETIAPPNKKDNNFWYWHYVHFNHDFGVDCCSDSSISFHYINLRMMWAMEFLIYHIHPFGINPQLTGNNVTNDIIQYLDNRSVAKVVKSKSRQ